MAAQGITTESIPPAGERVFLHRVANVSSGGDCYEVGDLVHPDLLRLAEQAAACFPSATHAGMDILAERLDAGLDTQRVIIAEVNLNNEIPMHIMPTYGEPTSVHETLIEAVLASPPAGTVDDGGSTVGTDTSGEGTAGEGAVGGGTAGEGAVGGGTAGEGAAATGAASTQPTAAAADTVDVAYLEDLLAAAAASNPPAGTEPPDHRTPDDPDDTLMPGREADGHQLRQEFLTAGYQAAAYRGALMFLRRDSKDAVLHRSGRSVVSREVGRRPEVLHALATVLGIPALDPADLRQQPSSSSSLTCQVLLIEGEVAGTLLSPSGGPDDDDPHPGDDGHLSRPTPPGVGLAHCPFPELAGYAEVLRAPLGETPILALSFALRPGADGQVWALQSLDPDPELAPFADPAAGVTADVYPSAAAALLKPDPYLLPPQQFAPPAPPAQPT